jgi:hypothetical protein
MKFTSQEIETAQRLKEKGLYWQPSVGHFVWDQVDLMKCESPFHDMVFYILDLKHFLRRSKTIERLQQDLCWLPTWYDARQILRHQGVTDAQVQSQLVDSRAIELGSERLCLYQMIEATLGPTQVDSNSQPIAAV